MPNTEATYNISLLLKTWAIMFGAVGIPAACFTGFSVYLLYIALGTLVFSFPVYVLVSWLGNSVGNIFFSSGGKISNREQLAGELNKAKFHMRQQEYNVAHQVIEAVVKVDPDYGDALLVKAQVEMKAGNNEQAKITLKQLRSVSKQDEPNYRWANSLLQELVDVN